MKRLHVHISVENLEQSIGFYSTLFGAKPTKLKADYAKWMLDDPRVNFAISSRGATPGLDHLGIQAEDESELSGLRERLKNADLQTFSEGETVCCYAQSDKSWVQDQRYRLGGLSHDGGRGVFQSSCPEGNGLLRSGCA